MCQRLFCRDSCLPPSLPPSLCHVLLQLVNWFGAGQALNGDAALLDFTCPGTTAMQYKLCRSATDAGGLGRLGRGRQ